MKARTEKTADTNYVSYSITNIFSLIFCKENQIKYPGLS